MERSSHAEFLINLHPLPDSSRRPGRIGLTLCSAHCTRQRHPFVHPRLPAHLRGEVRRPTRLQPRVCHRDQGTIRHGMVEREACTLAATS